FSNHRLQHFSRLKAMQLLRHRVVAELSDSNRERATPRAIVDPQAAYRQRTIHLLPSRRLRLMCEFLQQLDRGWAVPSRQDDSQLRTLIQQPANLVRCENYS